MGIDAHFNPTDILMATYAEALRKGVKDAFCQAATNASNIYELFKDLLPLAPRFPNVADFWRQFLCDIPPDPPPSPPFPGGQCDFCYKVFVTFTTTGSSSAAANGTFTQGYTLWGPIEGASVVPVIPPVQGIVQIAAYGHGTCDVPRSDSIVETRSPPVGGGPNANTVIDQIRVEPDQGQPDNCGNLPTPYPPYTPGGNNQNVNITYIDNNGNTIVVPIGVVFGYAKIDINANITIPFTLNLSPNFNFNGTFNFSTGDINFNIGGNPGDRGPGTGDPRTGPQPDDFDTPDAPSSPPTLPPNPDPNPPPKPEQRRVLVGAIVTSRFPRLGELTEIFQTGGNPNVIAPDLGLINFFYRFNSGASGWGEDIRIKNVQQFVPVAFKGGAVAVRGTPRANVLWTITPVYELVNIGDRVPA